MKRITVIGALMAFLLAGCVHKGNINFTYDHPERYQVGDAELEQPVKEIDVNWVSGNIDIVYADIPGVRIHEQTVCPLADSLRMRYYVDDEGCLDIQFCQSGIKYNVFDKPSAEGKSRSVCTMPRRENEGCEETNVQKTSTLEDIEKNLTIEVPRGTVLEGIELDGVSTHVRIDSVRSRKLDVAGVWFDVTAQYPELPEEIDIDGVDGNLTLMVPSSAGMTIEMNGVNKHLNVTSERPTRKEGGKTVIGDGSCGIDIDGVSITLNINEL